MIKRAMLHGLSLLPARMRRAIVNIGFNVDRDHFQTLATNYLFAPEMRRGLDFLKDKGFTPKTVLDIGAFEGSWSALALQVWPTAKIIMVEANPVKAQALRESAVNATVVEALLGAEQRDVPFHLMGSGSSALAENSPVARETITLTERTLDSLGVDANLIKIDVQGYELEVLRGGKKTLSKSEAVIIELSLIEINEGCPLIDEVLTFMRNEGFVTYDLMELHRRPLDQAMNQIDVLFIKEHSDLRADKRHFA